MKLDWGKGIGLFYATFVVVMVLMVVFSARNDVDLVQEDYYAKDLNYESFRQARENARKDIYQVSLNFKRQDELIDIQFPEKLEMVDGKAIMYRPSDKKQDEIIDIKVDSANKMIINTRNFESGLWKLKLEWNANEVPVYTEKVINI